MIILYIKYTYIHDIYNTYNIYICIYIYIYDIVYWNSEPFAKRALSHHVFILKALQLYRFWPTLNRILTSKHYIETNENTIKLYYT